MSNFIVLESKNVKAKGLKVNPPLDLEKIKSYFFSDDYEKLNKLNSLKVPLHTKNPILFYPGCGTDILSPLIYIGRLFPTFKGWTFTFIDTSNTFDIIKTILDNVGVSFEEKNNNSISFYWKDILVNLTFFQEDVFESIDIHSGYDIYFEKAFRIMKDQSPGYELLAHAHLSKGGVIISDSGFRNTQLEIIDVPKNLSVYNEMIIGVKK